MENKLIGKKVIIKTKESIYFNEWGTIQHIDDDGYYHIAIANGQNSMPIFERNEITIVKDQNRFTR